MATTCCACFASLKRKKDNKKRTLFTSDKDTCDDSEMPKKKVRPKEVYQNIRPLTQALNVVPYAEKSCVMVCIYIQIEMSNIIDLHLYTAMLDLPLGVWLHSSKAIFSRDCSYSV